MREGRDRRDPVVLAPAPSLLGHVRCKADTVGVVVGDVSGTEVSLTLRRALQLYTEGTAQTTDVKQTDTEVACGKRERPMVHTN